MVVRNRNREAYRTFVSLTGYYIHCVHVGSRDVEPHRSQFGRGKIEVEHKNMVHITYFESSLSQSITGHGKQGFPSAQPYLSHVPAG